MTVKSATMKVTKPKKIKDRPLPLLIEEHPNSYQGSPFLTFIQFRTEHVLAVVDNVHNNHIQCYVLDYCGPEGINELDMIAIAEHWFYHERDKYPISIALAKLEQEKIFNVIHRTYNVEFITRIVGPLFIYPIDEVRVTRRRKRKPLSPSTKVKRVVKLS